MELRKEFSINESDFKCSVCKICKPNQEALAIHEKSKRHKKAVRRQTNAASITSDELDIDLSEEKSVTSAFSGPVRSMVAAFAGRSSRILISPEALKHENYFIRKWIKLPEQNKLYHNTLTAFLALKFSFHENIKEVNISTNNIHWGEFGDIVVEVVKSCENFTDKQIFAVQCKQILERNRISKTTLIEPGKFSIKKQYDIITNLKKKLEQYKEKSVGEKEIKLEQFNKARFILYTVSQLSIENNQVLTFTEDITNKWCEQDQELWKNEKITVTKSKDKILTNITYGSSDCILAFEAINDELNSILSNFSFFSNQQKSKALRRSISLLLQEKFDCVDDLVKGFVKYICDWYKEELVYNFKLTRDEILLKLAELVLKPSIALPDAMLKIRTSNLWINSIKEFDLIITKNNPDTINKVYGSLNRLFENKFYPALDTSKSLIEITKSCVRDKSIKSQIFDGFETDSRTISLRRLYITLWKLGYVPLILSTENEKDLATITKTIHFLKNFKVPKQFIVMSNLQVNDDFFPENLKVFTNLKDIKKFNKPLMKRILKEVQIKMFDFYIPFREIVKYNKDVLQKTTTDTFLNLTLDEYYFGKVLNMLAPTESFYDTLVLGEESMDKIERYFARRRRGEDQNMEKTCCLSCQSARGKPKIRELLPNL